MLTAPVLVSAIPESYNSTKLIFSSTLALSDAGISFSVRYHDYISPFTISYPTFNGFFANFSATVGPFLSRNLVAQDFSRAHITYFKDNLYEILDYNPLNYDIQSNGDRQRRIYNITVLSSLNNITTTLLSNSLSAAAPSIPLMYSRANRTAVTDWVTVPLVNGRKRIYVATSGSDSNDGLTTDTAKLTVSSAYNILSSGDHILFRRGDTWTNQAFGGTSNGLPSNLCADSKSGSALDCPTFVGPWGDESLSLPTFRVTNSAISTFFLADNDDQYAGLKNFYIKCLSFTASGRDVREEANGDDYPSFFTLLNTGGSAVAAGINGADAHSDNILIEGCTFQEIGNAIVMNASYNSLVPGNDNQYAWGTSNFVSSYDASVGPACLTNILIRRNIFKDLYFLPAGSVSRSNSSNYINQVLNQYNSFLNYHLRTGALLASLGKQPKAIYLYGTSGTANMVDGNIFYRCGNKAETYPETYDRQVATVHSEGGFNGIAVIRNLFYKCANIAVKQLDGGSNINNIYYRNPHAITMMGDLGLFVKKTYQGVPTQETFPSVSAGLPVAANEGNFVPYWYFFDKNNALSIISKNVIEEPQDIGYNISVVSGSDVAITNNASMTVLPKSTAIEVLGGTLKVNQNYIGNISKGISTGDTAIDIKGFEVNIEHFSRGTSSVTHPSAVMQYSNKIAFDSNVINNHGSLRVKNFATNFGDLSFSNNFEPSALTITNNTIRNAVWNYGSPIIGLNSLVKEFGENYLQLYGPSLLASCNRLVFSNNKIGFNPGLAVDGSFRRRGILLLPSVINPQPVGEYSIEQLSGSMNSFFGTTTAERSASISSNTFTIPSVLQSREGDGVTPWLDNYLYTAQSLAGTNRDSQGWTIVDPYIHNNDPLHVSSSRIWYVDPVNGIDMFELYGSTPPTGWVKDQGSSLGVTSINGSSFEIGRHPQAPIKDIALAYTQLRHNYPDWILLKRGTTSNMSRRLRGRAFWQPTIPVVPDITRQVWYEHGNRNMGKSGLLWEKSGPSSDKRMVFASYGTGAESPLNLSNNKNWFGSLVAERPKLSMYSDAPPIGYVPNAGQPYLRYDNINVHITMENIGGNTATPPYGYPTSPVNQRVQNVSLLSLELNWEDNPSSNLWDAGYPNFIRTDVPFASPTFRTSKFMWKNLPKFHMIEVGTNPGLYNGTRPGPSFSNLLFEDVKFYNGQSGMSILGSSSGLDTRTNTIIPARNNLNLSPIDYSFLAPSSIASGIEIRRCQFSHLWSDDTFKESARSQAQDSLYGEFMYGTLIEDCIFDRVADKDLYVSSLNRRHEKNYRSNFTAHHIYFQPHVLGPIFRNNIWSRNCFDALQVRGGAHVLNNLFLKMPAAISMSAATSSINYFIKDNVMMNSYQMLNTPKDTAGGGYGDQAGGKFMSLVLGNVTIKDNIIYRTHNSQTLQPNNDRDGGSQGAFVFGGNYTPGNNISIPYPVRDVKVLSNIVYNWGGVASINRLQNMENGPLAPATPYNDYRVMTFQYLDLASSITVRDNDFINTDPQGIHRQGVTFDFYGGQTNFINRATNINFDVGGNRITLSSIGGLNLGAMNNVQQVLSRFNDNTSLVGAQAYFPNPFRSLLTYLRERDMTVPAFTNDRDGETLALEYFMEKALINRKGFVDEKFTATPVINYVREGFGKPAINYSFQEVDDFFLSAINNLRCNNSAIDFDFFPQNILNANLESLTAVTVSNPVPTGGGEIILPPVIPGGGAGPAPESGDSLVNPYEGADLVIYNPRSVAIKVVMDPEDPNSGIITLAPRKTTKIPYPTTLEIREPIQEVVARYNLSTMITRYAQVIARGFGSIPVPVSVTETPAPVVPVVD